jgi:glycerol-3-phosphate dehydrogenase (NAD+)
MRAFSKALYPSVRDDTFMESCGVGDLVATCYGGRNRLVACEWTKAQMEGKPRTFEDLETDLLKGQKLQGVLTSNEVQEILKVRGWESQYPLFTTVNRIINGYLPPKYVVEFVAGAKYHIRRPGTDDEEIVPVRPKRPAAAGGVATAPILAA